MTSAQGSLSNYGPGCQTQPMMGQKHLLFSQIDGLVCFLNSQRICLPRCPVEIVMNNCSPSSGQFTSLQGLPIWSYPLKLGGSRWSTATRFCCDNSQVTPPAASADDRAQGTVSPLLCQISGSSYFHPQPPPHHLTVWTGSADQTEALLGKPMQSTEWPPSSPLQELLLCSSLLLLLPADPASAAASPDELVPVPAETNFQRLFEASQCSLPSDLPLSKFPVPSPAFLADERLCSEHDLSVYQPSTKNCCSLSR